MTTASANPGSSILLGQITVLKVAVVVSTIILTGAAFWALRRIFEPFVLALFLLIMVDGMARAMTRRAPFFPAKASLPLAFLLIVGLFALTVWVTADNAGDFASHAGEYTARINAQLDAGAQHLGLRVTPTLSDLIHRLNPARYAGAIAGGLSHFAEAAVFVMIYLGFLVASRQGFAQKAQALFTTVE